MKFPRISLFLATAASVMLGVAAFKTYLPMLRLMPNPLAQEATALCEKIPTCLAAQARVTGRMDRSAMVQHVTFDFRAMPSNTELDRLRTQLAKTAGPDGALRVDYLVNGTSPPQPAASAGSVIRRRVGGGAKP